MRKLPFVFLLLLLIAVLFCGCAESVTYTYYMDGSGAVHKIIRFEYDADAEDAEIVKEEAVQVMAKLIIRNDWSDYSEVDTSTDGVVELRVTYPSRTEYAIALGQTGREEHVISEHENEGLLTGYETHSTFQSDAFDTKVRELLGEGYETVPLTGCDFYYVFGTTYRTTESNADSVEKRDGIYYHTWKLDPTKDRDIIYTQYGLNGVLIYALIILVFVLSLAVIFVIIVNSNRKNKAVFRSVTVDPTTIAESDDREQGE